MHRLPITRALLLLLIALPAAAAIRVGGSLQNDTFGLLDGGAGRWGTVTEARGIITTRGKGWQVYHDMRLYYNAGDVPGATNELTFSLVRSFLRIAPVSVPIELTVGKTYVNLGAPVLFNPFELDRELALNDLSRTKEGLAAITAAVFLGEGTGIRVYTAPEEPAWSAGGALFARIGKADIQLVYNRITRDRNLAGFTLRGDLLFGISLAGAIHFDDGGHDPFIEATAALDYSFGSFFIKIGGYYNGRGTSGTYTSAPQDSWTAGRLTAYLQTRYRVDEFLSFTLDCFGNPEDPSAALLPGMLWTMTDGLTCTVILSVPVGKSGGEYAPDRLGDLALLTRLKAKF